MASVVASLNLAGAAACFYKALGLGVTAEEGSNYDPGTAQYPILRHMDVIAVRWDLGAEVLLFVATLFASWTLHRHLKKRRTLA